MRSGLQRATPLVLLLLLPLAPVGADSTASLKDLAADVESVAREISVTTVLMLAYDRLGQAEDVGKAKQKIRALVARERQALDELERCLEGEAPEPASETAVDALLEKIKSYQLAQIPVFENEFLVTIIRDSKQDLRTREAAVAALCSRFGALNPSPRISEEKDKIGRALLPGLADNAMEVRTLVAGLFKQFWPGMYYRSGYEPTATNFRERHKAYKMWREYLKR